jgi:hypothetical protein
MTSVREFVRRRFQKAQPLPAGIYHYQAPPEDPRNYRLHLRLEKDGSGVLVVNAATILHLNVTAAEYAYHMVQGTQKDEAVKQISKRYLVTSARAEADYADFVDRIESIVDTPDLDPEMFLDFERSEINSEDLSAPFRLDCALTYRLPEGADPSLAPTKRVDRELTTEEWKSVLDKAWQAGIPHIVFTGGEPTLREDLPDLVARAEANGQVTGLLSDGLRLSDPVYMDTLLKTGLDHLMIIFQPGKEYAWEGLSTSLVEDLFVAVHVTITPETASTTMDLLKWLASQGVKAVSLSISDPGLNVVLTSTRDQVAALGLSLVWDLPVPYSAMNPVALETEVDAVHSGAGHAWLYVEPDGDVLPAQGINNVLGNVLRDPWDQIWSKAKALPVNP